MGKGVSSVRPQLSQLVIAVDKCSIDYPLNISHTYAIYVQIYLLILLYYTKKANVDSFKCTRTFIKHHKFLC